MQQALLAHQILEVGVVEDCGGHDIERRQVVVAAGARAVGLRGVGERGVDIGLVVDPVAE